MRRNLWSSPHVLDHRAAGRPGNEGRVWLCLKMRTGPKLVSFLVNPEKPKESDALGEGTEVLNRQRNEYEG